MTLLGFHVLDLISEEMLGKVLVFSVFATSLSLRNRPCGAVCHSGVGGRQCERGRGGPVQANVHLLCPCNSCPVRPAPSRAERTGGGDRLPLGVQRQLQLRSRLPALSLGHPVLRGPWGVEG